MHIYAHRSGGGSRETLGYRTEFPKTQGGVDFICTELGQDSSTNPESVKKKCYPLSHCLYKLIIFTYNMNVAKALLNADFKAVSFGIGRAIVLQVCCQSGRFIFISWCAKFILSTSPRKGYWLITNEGHP